MSDIESNSKKRWIQAVLLAGLVGLLLLKSFVLDIYTVPQEGMLPSISPGGHFIGKKHPYRDPSRVRRGDVIVFSRELPDGQRYQFVWRVVGLPGDRVETAGDSVIVNGKELAREQLRAEEGLVVYREQNGEAAYEVAYPTPVSGATAQPKVTMVVPAGEFFTLGDNRHAARDSRYDGTVPFGQIVARKL